MKPEPDDDLLEAMIRRGVGSEDAQFDAAAWKHRYCREVEFIESNSTNTVAEGHRRQRSWRSIMAKGSNKIVASAAIVVGIVVAAAIYATCGGSTVAMAAFLEQLQTKCYEFEMGVRTEDGASTSVKGVVLEPGKMRLEQRGGLGTITSVIDNDAQQSLILLKRFKTACRFDGKEAKEIGILGFLTLPRRSIEGLWSLEAGDETSLGRKDIDGKSAEGFRVTQRDEEYSRAITVWADAKTGHPLEVEIVWQSNEEKAALELLLRDFRVVPEPNTALFSTEVPEGYTLTDRQTLEQLAAESDTTSSTTESTSAQAKTVLNALALWADGKKQEAVELLVAVDWNDDLRFGQEHHLFAMRERQYISLVSADQKEVMDGVMMQSSQCQAIASEMMELGRKARTSEDAAQAEEYFSTTMRLGQLLNRDRETMLIARLVGIAIQKLALAELSSLYHKLGETEKLRGTRAKVNQIEEQMKQIKKKAAGE